MKKPRILLIILSFLITAVVVSACGITIELNDEPDVLPTATVIEEPAMPTDVPLPAAGSISGNLSYPSEFIPPMRVVAFRLANGQPSGEFVFVETALNQGNYQLDNLVPGQYWVVAYTIPEGEGIPQGLAGGFSQAVPCGLSVECGDHSLLAVDVVPGQTTADVNPADWYAPEGAFPPDPAN